MPSQSAVRKRRLRAEQLAADKTRGRRSRRDRQRRALIAVVAVIVTVMMVASLAVGFFAQ